MKNLVCLSRPVLRNLCLALILSPILSYLFLIPVADAEDYKGPVPTPLERKMIEMVVVDEPLGESPKAGDHKAEIQRAQDIAGMALKLDTKKQADSDGWNYENRLDNLRKRYDLTLTEEQMVNIVTDPDPQSRLKALREGSEGLDEKALKSLDDDLFWASLDRGDKAEARDFVLDESFGVEVRVDPETRKGSVNVYDSGEKSGLPMDLVIPTVWKPVTKEIKPPEEIKKDIEKLKKAAEQAGQQTLPDAKSAADDDGDLFNPVPDSPVTPVRDEDRAPVLLTETDFKLAFDTIDGFWKVGTFSHVIAGLQEQVWHIKAGDLLGGDILNKKEDVEKRLKEIDQAIDALKQGGISYIWENTSTGEKVYQKRFKRIKGDEWEYLGEGEDGEAKTKIEELEDEKKILQARLNRTPEDRKLDTSGFERLAASPKAKVLTVRVLGSACPHVKRKAYFDGRTLGVHHKGKKICLYNPDLPDSVRSYVIASSKDKGHTVMMRVSTDPASGNMTFRGAEWGYKTSYDSRSYEVKEISGPFRYGRVGSQRPSEDENVLEGTAQGADERAAL